MRNPARQIFGISIFWLALSLLFDGLNTLALPYRLAQELPAERQAGALGLLTFAGLSLGMLVQPLAGLLSDRAAPRAGRKGMLAAGLAGCLLGLAALALASGVFALAAGFALAQVGASWAQAAQQGFLPDLIPAERRGTASGMKSLMDLTGAMLGFVLLGQLLGSGQAGLALGAIAAVLAAAFLLTTVLVRERDRLIPAPAGHKPAARPGRQFFWLVISRFLFLLGTYAVGRFLVLFVAARLGLDPAAAAEQAGGLLAGLALITILASLPAGWAADRLGRLPLMLAGAVVSAFGALLFGSASSQGQLFLFGGLLSLGSALFAGASWALTADLAPAGQAGRFFGLANLGTAGAAAAAGLFGPMVDRINASQPGQGFTALFWAAALAFLLSTLPLLALRSPKDHPASAGVQLTAIPEVNDGKD